MFSLLLASLFAAPSNVSLAEGPKKLPDGLKANGKVVALATFDDTDGSHAVYVEQAKSKKGDLELRAFGFVKKGKWEKVWAANDFVRDCDLDSVLEYRAKSLGITDLDEDGVAEVTFAYELTCAGDVSPRTLKILMYEAATKYAVRGETIVDVGGGEKVGGSHTPDASLQGAPAFAKHLESRWKELTAP